MPVPANTPERDSADSVGDQQMRLIDLLHQGRPRIIASWLVGDVIVDPGPSSCLERLLAELDQCQPRVLALTHIHLDHAGAAGSLVRRFPQLEVWVHERGAAHLVDPSRLLASAGRLYGARMQSLWGEVAAVPAERIRVLRDGERIGGLRVAQTPGHASHHLVYLHEDSGRLFSGDVGGVRLSKRGPVLAPTPPPDIDLQDWRGSLKLIEDWHPSAIMPTHFGLYTDVAEHLAAPRESLELAEGWARCGQRQQFTSALRERMTCGDPDLAQAYELAMPPEQCYQGLGRYLAND